MIRKLSLTMVTVVAVTLASCAGPSSAPSSLPSGDELLGRISQHGDRASPWLLVSPRYPDAAVDQGRTGSARFSFYLDKRGRPERSRVLERRGDKAFAAAGLESLRGSRFVPACNAEAWRGPYRVTYRFELVDGEPSGGVSEVVLADEAQHSPSRPPPLEIVEQEPPTFPSGAYRAGKQGAVGLIIELDGDGSPSEVRSTFAVPDDTFVRPATEAAHRWRFANESGADLEGVELCQMITFNIKSKLDN